MTDFYEAVLATAKANELSTYPGLAHLSRAYIALLDELEAAEARIAELADENIQTSSDNDRLFDQAEGYRVRIAELEENSAQVDLQYVELRRRFVEQGALAEGYRVALVQAEEELTELLRSNSGDDYNWRIAETTERVRNEARRAINPVGSKFEQSPSLTANAPDGYTFSDVLGGTR